jgi:hypothetical protein
MSINTPTPDRRAELERLRQKLLRMIIKNESRRKQIAK